MALEMQKAMISGESFEETAWVHFDYISKVALKLARDEDDANDLVQETFLRAFRFFGSYEPGTNCKAWLCKILKNTGINRYRQQRRHPSTDFEAIGEIGESHAYPPGHRMGDPEETLINSILKEEVLEAFAQLTPRYRQVLSLSLMDGFSYREISDRVGCPIGTVMSRIHRARKLTREWLLKQAGAPPRAASKTREVAAGEGGHFVRTTPGFPHATPSATAARSPGPQMISMSAHATDGAGVTVNLRRTGEISRN